tara:strand:+ start:133 stop:525 length:393 start_codon:yes stop_codon:yes gene_type:complete
LNKFFKENSHQIIKFIISGIIASAVNFLIYNFLYLIFRKIIFASILGYISGLLVSFLFAKVWVFKDKSKGRKVKSFLIFCLIYFVGGVEMSLIIFFLNHLILNYKIAWIFGLIVAALNNYLGSKYLLFKK